MKRALLGLGAVGAFVITIVLVLAGGGGTARGQPEPTPTPVPDPCEGVCLTGFWQATYRNYPDDIVGHCSYDVTQSGSSTTWGEISCTHAWEGNLSGSLDQGSREKHDVINFGVPVCTVESHGTFSPDGGWDEGTWACTAACTESGTYTSTRIEAHAEEEMPPSGGVTVYTALNDELTVPQGALPSGTTVTVDFDTLPTAPPEGLVTLSRAIVLGPEDPPHQVFIDVLSA